MNLNQIAARVVRAVNPQVRVVVQISTGSQPNPDGTRTPTYADPIAVIGQVQPMTWRDIQQIQGLNLQGTRKKIYLNGEIDGLIRSTSQGGDLVTFPDGSTFLVAIVLEGWDLTAGWCCVAVTLQNDTPFGAT